MDEKPLPKAYGIWRLEWDEELATFAQVLANQCVMKHDLCRATTKFSNPGQSVGVMRFSYPKWGPIKADTKNEFTTSFSLSMVDIAILNILKKWYKQKSYITPEIIKEYRDNSNGSLYLHMVYGAATHIGCGVSAYTDYVFNLNNADILYNVIELICNFSEKPQHGKPIYDTEPPSKNTHTVSGCPVDTAEEDANGLCYPKINKNQSDGYSKKDLCDKFPNMCKKELPIVILPIFSIGNHPIDGSPSNFTNNRRHFQRGVEVRNVRSYSDAMFNPYKNKQILETYGPGHYKKRSNIQIGRYSRLNNARVKYGDDIISIGPSIRFADGRHFEGWLAPNSRKNSLNLITEKNDTRLWTLLNRFEFEIKHTKLRPEEREILNENIRKIYENLKTKRYHKIDELQIPERKKSSPERELLVALQQRPIINNLAYSRQNLKKNEFKRDFFGNKKESTRISHSNENEENYQMNRPVLIPGS